MGICLHVCAPCGCPLLINVGRECWIPLGLESTEGCELVCGCWESNPRLLEEQQVLLTAEPSLQPSFFHVIMFPQYICLHMYMHYWLIYVCKNEHVVSVFFLRLSDLT